MKTCNKCNIPKEETDFHKSKSYKSGYSNTCKKCANGYKKKWVEDNPENWKKSYRQFKYGLSDEQYQGLLNLQNHQCAICGITFGTGKYKGPFIDHDHTCCPGKKSCGKCIRGLICGDCNLCIGHSKDNTLILRNAINYLESYA